MKRTISNTENIFVNMMANINEYFTMKIEKNEHHACKEKNMYNSDT